MSDLLNDLGRRMHAALAPLAGPITYSVVETFGARVWPSANVGDTDISLTGLPESFVGVKVGDVLSLPTPRRARYDHTALDGDVDVMLDAPLIATIVTGTPVTIRRTVETICRGWSEGTTRSFDGVLVDGSTIINVITDSLPTPPKVDGRLVIDGRAWTIKAVETDPTGAVWRLTCA